MREAFIISAVRTAVGRSKKGGLASVYSEDMAALTMVEALKRAPGLKAADIDDVIVGCAIPAMSQGYNIGRNSALRAGFPYSVPGVTVNRFCSSGVQTIAMGAQAIMTGMGECIIAGGVESMTKLPMEAQELIPNAWLIKNRPELYQGMGMTAENLVKRYGISREDQDAFSLKSHQKAIAAIDAGRFKSQIVPVPVTTEIWVDGKRTTESAIFDADDGPRRDSSLEGLAKLKPVFMPNGSVTAGNASQTSDGAASVLLLDGAKMKALGLKPLARLVGYSVAGVDPSVMGLGPVEAVPKVLRQTGLSLKDIGLIELNEAFAAQSIAVMRDLSIDPAITNVNGGAIALGHPLGCSGAKLTVQLLEEMRRRKVRYGMVTMCIGGGMGAAAIFECL